MGKLLVIADIENKCSATPRGLELAAKLGQGVDVVAFTHAPLKRMQLKAGTQPKARRSLLEKREADVQARIDKYRQPDQDVKLKVVWEKDIPKWINKHCASGKYDTVLKTGHRSESLIHTSTDWQLLRECPAPVLIVAEKKWHRTRPVLVTLDLGTELPAKRKLNHKVLDAGIRLARTLDVELEIITAIEIPTLLSTLDLVDPIAFAKEARAGMQRHLSELAAAHEIPEKAFKCKRGPIEKVLTSRAAKVRAQIVVMGTVARTGVQARLLGNTAEKVLRHMKTDVLAIKP